MRGTVINRFEDKFMPEPNSGCWLWFGCSSEGYGQFNLHGKTFYAHRLAYELYKNPIPEEMQVLHKCDVPCCVNPDHLWLGSHVDNMADMARKGRNKGPREGPFVSIVNPYVKLTMQEADEIRSLYPRYSQTKIATMYNTTQSLVSLIVRNLRYTQLINNRDHVQ